MTEQRWNEIKDCIAAEQSLSSIDCDVDEIIQYVMELRARQIGRRQVSLSAAQWMMIKKWRGGERPSIRKMALALGVGKTTMTRLIK